VEKPVVNHVFGMSRARHLKFCVLNDTSACMILPKVMCVGSGNPFEFWEIIYNISETVQDSYTVARDV